MEMHGGGGGGGGGGGASNETPLSADASWSEEMERNAESKFNNDAPMMNNQRNQNNRNQRLASHLVSMLLYKM